MSEKRQANEGRIVDFVAANEGATVDEVAAAVGVTRSTARKYLAELAVRGAVTRIEGGRERGRKRPDRFSAPENKGGEEASQEGPAAAKKPRLSPGRLDDLVLGYMREHRGESPHTASRIGKGIGRSSGAIANCLARLAGAERVVLVQQKPRAYDLPKDE